MDDMTELKNAVEKLQAEMEWVKVVLGRKPHDPEKRASPPWVTTLALIGVPIATAVIATKPWG